MNTKIRLHGALRAYMTWPVVFGVVFLACDILLFTEDITSGFIGALCLVVYVIFALLISLTGRRRMRKNLVEFAANYGTMQADILDHLDVPYAILSEEGQLLWGNDRFFKLVANKKAAKKNIMNVLPEITITAIPKLPEPREVHLKVGEQYFRCVLNLVVGKDQTTVRGNLPLDQLIDTKRVVSLCMYEETDVVNSEKARLAENLVVGLLYIDNYEELVDSIDEERQSFTMALIDRQINRYMQKIDAISKKMEKDKFLFVLKQSRLDVLRENRFSILEEIRGIDLGNGQNASVSIGIGVSRGTFTERYDWARAAIDLALGRGGDQAVIKEGDREEFFGGKRTQIERNTRVKARVRAHALQELIESKEKVVAMAHTMGDADSFGACAGIYRIAKTLNRKAHIVLGDIDSSVRPFCDRFKTKDYDADTIITAKQAKGIVDNTTLLVVVDVNRQSYAECPELIDLAQTVVVIDHHRQSGDAIDKAVLFYIEPYASSTSEMVAEIAQYIGNGLRLHSPESEAMYAGIMIDTNFFSDKIGVRTFEAMAYLRRYGVDTVRVRKAFRDTIEEYRIKAAAIQQTELYRGTYAITTSPGEDAQGIEGIESPTVLGAKIANELLDINGVKASFVLTPYNGKIYISARSIDELNVQVMMERLGGGGHINMAGAQIAEKSVKEVKEMVKSTLDEMIVRGEA